MYLHEAIIDVLKKSGIPMTCAEIADKINSSKMYSKGDATTVEGSQISARINVKTYSHFFKKDKNTRPMLVSLR